MSETPHEPHRAALDYTIAENKLAGSRPGTLIVPSGSPEPRIEAYFYDSEVFTKVEKVEVGELGRMMNQDTFLWLDVNGLGNAETIATIGEAFGFHRLSLEDVMSLSQRPKVEDYEEYLFAVAQFPLLDEAEPFEQISLFVGRRFLVTFQAYETNRLYPVLNRLNNTTTRVRRSGPDYLAYAVLDLVIDAYFPLLERYDRRLEEIEVSIKRGPKQQEIEELFSIKRALAHIRRHMWGSRDAMTFLTREEHPALQPDNQIYFRDVQDHAVRILEFSESAKDTCTALTDYHLAQQGQRMNEIMKVLTIIATVFIPLTFVAGVYGMNFDTEASGLNMPELAWKYGYPVFWLFEAGIFFGMMVWFRRIGWIGGTRRKNREE